MAIRTTDLLELDRAGGVVTLSLNRPEQRNALSRELMRELVAALAALGEDPEVRVVVLAARGAAACAGPHPSAMVEVARSIGRKRALELLLTGTPINAETAAAWGLVNRVVAPDELEAATHELAQRIAS